MFLKHNNVTLQYYTQLLIYRCPCPFTLAHYVYGTLQDQRQMVLAIRIRRYIDCKAGGAIVIVKIILELYVCVFDNLTWLRIYL